MKEGWLNCDLNVSWKVWLTMNVERWTLKTDVRWMLKLDDGHPKFKSVYVLENDLKSNGHNSNFVIVSENWNRIRNVTLFCRKLGDALSGMV